MYTKFVYLQMNRDDLEKAGLRYSEDKPVSLSYWSYKLYQIPENGYLKLGSRKLWLRDGIYRMNITYYVCGIQTYEATLTVDGATATITLSQTK